MRIRGSLVVNFIMIAVFASVLVISRDYPTKTLLFPLIIAIIGLTLCIGELARELIRTVGFRTAKAVKEPKGKATPRVEAKVVLWVFIALGTIVLFGFWVAIPVFIIAFMRIYGHESWKLTMALAGGTWVVFYLVFHVAMRVYLYGGILGLTFS